MRLGVNPSEVAAFPLSFPGARASPIYRSEPRRLYRTRAGSWAPTLSTRRRGPGCSFCGRSPEQRRSCLGCESGKCVLTEDEEEGRADAKLRFRKRERKIKQKRRKEKLKSSSYMEEDDVKNETKNQKCSRQSARVVKPLLVGRELAGQVPASFFRARPSRSGPRNRCG